MPTITAAGMTRTSPPGTRVRRQLLSVIALGALLGVIQAQERQMKTTAMTWWQLLEALVGQIPFTQAGVEALLGIPLVETRRSRHGLRLQGGGVVLDQGLQLVGVDLRLSFAPGDPGFMVLQLGAGCVSLEAVRQHYGALQITELPGSDAPDAETMHTAFLPWGKLSFGMAGSAGDCLASIVLEPQK